MDKFEGLEDEFSIVKGRLHSKPKAKVTTLELPELDPNDEDAMLLAAEQMIGARLTENSLSDEQQQAFSQVTSWFDTLNPEEAEILTLGGYAGTGKTTLLCALAEHYENKRIAFCSLTGKAVSVLRKKFASQNVRFDSHDISTIHRLLYTPITDKHGAILRWDKKSFLDYDLIVIDEGSMVSEQILEDFMEFNIPIFAVGDHGQLPPVDGAFNLMGDPDFKLEHIHRQAKDSPVLALSEEIRNTGKLPASYANCLEVQFLQKTQLREVLSSLYKTPGFKLDDLALLCFSNKTRIFLNDVARNIRWGTGAATPILGPRIGDQIICLRNSYDRIFNGMRGELMDIRETNPVHYRGTVDFRDERVRFAGSLNHHQFGRERVFKDLSDFTTISGLKAYSWDQLGLLADYGYALTVHKAQGSEFEYVILYDDYPWDRFPDPDFYKRWAYTAISRCRKYLVVLR